MRRRLKTIATAARASSRDTLWFVLGVALIAGFTIANRAHASSALCSAGQHCSLASFDPTRVSDSSLLDFASTLQLSRTPARGDELSNQEYLSFSGIGAVVCTVNGRRRMSTAFLVGAFDIGVTVAHTFDDDGAQVAAKDCIYTTTDSLGQIRERIPISYVRSQWDAEAGANGHAAKDFAVIRLSTPSHYAQRTMPMGRFSGTAVSVLMVGFRSNMESDPLKAKSRGTVYERKAHGISLASLEGFTHDIDAHNIAAGAPVIDESSGVIIGVHTLAAQHRAGATRNTMIPMNEWLEQTLRAEIQSEDEKGANSGL